MKKYSVTTTWELRQLCIDNNWFTCGTIEQYEKLFYANEHGCPIEEIATIIWLCSDEDCRRADVLDILTEVHKLHKLDVLQATDILLRMGVDEGYESLFED